MKVINSAYGSIPHLPTSQVKSDKVIPEGQKRIATEQKRGRHDKVFVQLKLDGSCVGVLRDHDEIIPVNRAGYHTDTSPYRQHHEFSKWVYKRQNVFLDLLDNGQRIMGEWLLQAHGTKYDIMFSDELFRAFDIIENEKRLTTEEFYKRVNPTDICTVPAIMSATGPVSVDYIKSVIEFDHSIPAEPRHEGAVWRVERNQEVDFLCKWVRPDKIDGQFLPSVDDSQVDEPIWNYNPDKVGS
jgi:hypothetical protein